ncbi:hypothetical protein BV898_00646 [Hypsibius exemplaris]|uniref:Uncharacterized protein n=1 Tax=Hypsibius exemplaris TaxID=2072580 RepID=A0A1W0XE18_HYPEX|nr:hypothetical protein BV898_00646 [Hypsibius exemplaris]
MVEPPIRFPKTLFLLSTIEICLAIIFLSIVFAGCLLAYFYPSYQDLLNEYWTWIKTMETGLEIGNYITLCKAGKLGRAAARPRVGREINTFYSDFLTWNSLGAIMSIMQFIIVAVEIIFLAENSKPAIVYLATYPMVGIVVTLSVQSLAMSLDVVPWQKCPTPRELYRCLKLLIMGGGKNVRVVGRYRDLVRDDSECGLIPVTAQTSVCSKTSTSTYASETF